MEITADPNAALVPIDRLRPWAKNPRKNDPAVNAVAESIRKLGFGAPLLVRRANDEIIAGHTRLKAAAKLGLTEVPVRYVDVTDAQAHLLAIADNKLGEIATWDDALLADFLGPLMLQWNDVGEVAGFKDDDILALLKSNADEILKAAENDNAQDESSKVQMGFVVLVDCTDEEHQREVIEKLLELGLKCRALV